MKIRRAVQDDISHMVEAMDERRRLYETYQPRFWRRSPSARSTQAAFFKTLISKENAIVLIAEDASIFRGFAIATVVEAPPVYAPGGKTCMVDDFATTHNDWDDTGRALLGEVNRLAKAAGAVQAVVTCGHLDEAKRSFLHSDSFSIASEWFVKNL